MTAPDAPAAGAPPRVTVLVPNLDQGRYLGRCLDSVLGQTYGRWHAVVADNASTDDSVAVVRHGLTGTQTEVIPIGRIDLINATTQIVQLREA